jgi:hypothetical protein
MPATPSLKNDVDPDRRRGNLRPRAQRRLDLQHRVERGLAINDFVYDPNGTANSSLTTLIQGAGYFRRRTDC